jgi:hypothetical protein
MHFIGVLFHSQEDPVNLTFAPRIIIHISARGAALLIYLLHALGWL